MNKPGIYQSNIHTDAFFGRSRVTMNTEYLNLASELPFTIADADLSGLLDADETLATALENKKLYVEDHSSLAPILTPYIAPGRHFAFPTVLFYKSSKGLMPLAIRTNPDSTGYIVTPKDSAADWEFAKLMANSASFFRIQFIDHFMESVSQSTVFNRVITDTDDANMHAPFFYNDQYSFTASCF
jgi:hypothetical protein